MQVEVARPARLNGEDLKPGDVVDLDSSLAAAWMRAGLAAAPRRGPGRPPKSREDPVETAVKEPGEEKAVKRGGSKK